MVKEEQKEEGQEKGFEKEKEEKEEEEGKEKGFEKEKEEKVFEKEKEEKEEEVEAKGLKDLNPISVEYWQVPDVSSTRRNFLLYLKFVFL